MDVCSSSIPEMGSKVGKLFSLNILSSGDDYGSFRVSTKSNKLTS